MGEQFIAAEPYPWPHDGRLVPGTTALLIIDMQRDFCASGGYIDAQGYDIAPARTLIPRLVALRHAMARWGGQVIHTREGHLPDLSDLPALKAWRSRRNGGGIGSRGPLGRLLVRGEPGWDIIDELTPQDGEWVIDKPGYSAFHATDLDHRLRLKGIDKLILTGVTTDVCVHSSLRDAVDRGYECLVVSDGCAATDPDNHRAALATIATEGGIFGAVATVADVLAAVGSTA